MGSKKNNLRQARHSHDHSPRRHTSKGALRRIIKNHRRGRVHIGSHKREFEAIVSFESLLERGIYQNRGTEAQRKDVGGSESSPVLHPAPPCHSGEVAPATGAQESRPCGNSQIQAEAEAGPIQTASVSTPCQGITRTVWIPGPLPRNDNQSGPSDPNPPIRAIRVIRGQTIRAIRVIRGQNIRGQEEENA